MMNPDNIVFNSTITYDITIGIDSMFTRENVLHIDEVMEIVCGYLYKNKVDFSLRVKNGGYTYQDNSFEVENNIVLTFIGGDLRFITQIAKNLKMLLEQETILITRRNMEIAFV